MPLTRPWRQLGPLAALALMGVALRLAPAAWVESARGGVLLSLEPGRRAAEAVARGAARVNAQLVDRNDLANQLAEVDQRNAQLQQRVGQLEAQLASDRANAEKGRLAAHWTPARLLGSQAREFLARRGLLDAGRSAGIEPGQVAVNWAPPTIDRGEGQVRSGQPVCYQGRVCGKVLAVSAFSSTLQAPTDRGYRDLVAIGPAGREVHGVLEGVGEPLARVRLVPVSTPVAAGDPVYSLAATGLSDERLLAGVVARAERTAGATHWDLWLAPAMERWPDRLAVLAIDLEEPRP